MYTPEPFRNDDPAAFTDALLGSIHGIELRIESVQSKWKLSQNRSAADLAGAISGLAADGATELVAHMQSIAGD